MSPRAAISSLTWELIPVLAVKLYKQNAVRIKEAWEKRGYNALRRLGEHMQLFKGEPAFGVIPSTPSPLLSMLVSGLGGAALGYGVGALGETMLPSDWRRNRLRKTVAMIGALTGTAPGLMWGTSNLMSGRDFNDPTGLLNPQDKYVESEYKYPTIDIVKHIKIREGIKEAMAKIADYGLPYGPGSFAGSGLGPNFIDVNEFNQIVWKDPRVSLRLDDPTKALATGIVTGAANLPQKMQDSFVTPSDIGVMAAGMGAGYLSGKLVGTGLGLLMGAPQHTQELLKNTGMWAGAIKALIPRLFGG